MTYEQAKQHYLAEETEFAMATETQVDKLSAWLDKNDMANTAHERWENCKEELEYLMAEFL
jgi:predicted nucleotidyltransferase